MEKQESYIFLAAMDSMGRLRIPATGRKANGYKPGTMFKVMIVPYEGVF